MNLHRLLLAPVAALALIGAAPTPPPATDAQAERVRATVEFLADDLLEGRGAGKRGHEVAALFVASRFRGIGLLPAGENGGWYQRVPFRRAVHSSPPQAVLKGRGADRALTHGAGFTIRPSVTEATRRIEAELVFVGHGISDPRLKLDDYAGLDLKGKIAVVVGGVPRGLPSDIAAHLGQQKDEMAAAAGAVGLIELSPAGAGGGDRPVTDWVDANGIAGSLAPGLKLRGSFARAFAETLFAGMPQSLKAIFEARAAGRRMRGFPLRARLSLTAQSTWTSFTSPAVLGRLAGADPQLSAETVILMGHLDHLGLRDDAKPGEDAIHNGALDNAAGIATMLEAAERFVGAPDRPRRSLLFIAHTGEELGLLGASYWAVHPTVPLGSVAAAVNLDMPVPLYPFTDVIAFGADHSDVGDAVAQAGRSMGITVGPDPMPEQGIFTRSDHYPLVLRGIPSVLLFTGHANGGKAAYDRFFAGTYHRPGDDLSQAIDWHSLARYGELSYRIARTLADAPRRARWRPGDYFAKP